MKTFNDRVNARMKELGLNPNSLARALGTRQSTVRDITIGKSKSYRKINVLAAALETTPDWLLSGTETPDTGAAKLAAAQKAKLFDMLAEAASDNAASKTKPADALREAVKRHVRVIIAKDAEDDRLRELPDYVDLAVKMIKSNSEGKHE